MEFGIAPNWVHRAVAKESPDVPLGLRLRKGERAKLRAYERTGGLHKIEKLAIDPQEVQECMEDYGEGSRRCRRPPRWLETALAEAAIPTLDEVQTELAEINAELEEMAE